MIPCDDGNLVRFLVRWQSFPLVQIESQMISIPIGSFYNETQKGTHS